MPVQTIIKLRRDTAANWTGSTAVLAAGEIGLETDTKLMKMGDGTTVWSSLPYVSLKQLSNIKDVTLGGVAIADGHLLNYQSGQWVNNSPANLNILTTSSAVPTPTLSTAANGFGYTGIPQVTATTGSVTIAAADAGKHFYSSATRIITIPANGSVALPLGTVITFASGPGATTTIAINTDKLYIAGSGTGAAGQSRTLAPYGMATAIKVASDTWFISGVGLS